MIKKYAIAFTGYVEFNDEDVYPHPEDLSLEELLNTYQVLESNYSIMEQNKEKTND